MDRRAHQAAIRFGLGPRPDQPLPDDPIAWLDAQLDAPDRPPPPPQGMERPPEIADGYRIWRELDAAGQPGPGQRNPIEENFQAEARAALAWRIDTDAPYRERLVEFWANHFTVSKRAGYPVSTVLGPYLRQAIRPHVTGRFAEMLLAVERHPAMLGYLDQNASVGPNSAWGRRSGRGLNENLAREILELHTLSPAAGYSQQDVTEFARLLTGWGYERNREPFGTLFRAANHEPGEKRLLGRAWPEGPEASEAALRFLADHPATHRHLALKLVRHFVADDPPAEAVARIESVLRDTDGDLKAVARALPRLDSAWAAPLSKLRAPQDYVTAAFRACGASGDAMARPAYGAGFTLNQPWCSAPQPNGWPDTAAAWLGPEPVMQRLDWAFDTAGRFARLDPMAVLETALGPLAGEETRQAVRRAGSPREGLALLFASAEFQRR
ncbi:DUF1800 domain-containing protein [Teichococcus cervicalis]|uniref:DUF1800 domain-containing protein n=1 Tax=Pseudoroseomonas cervicalis ATCC 49957 TaxID=525371 RepID=D5RMZ0_9PROT|nr:DUF1800 domain-containing protein [Pseudoroseomonas cervicalis]EFH11329.1 hypothetical protein HMPREF0731_2451 [Pseudoroseomonas cervicalis ATCC 49957]